MVQNPEEKVQNSILTLKSAGDRLFGPNKKTLISANFFTCVGSSKNFSKIFFDPKKLKIQNGAKCGAKKKALQKKTRSIRLFFVLDFPPIIDAECVRFSLKTPLGFNFPRILFQYLTEIH